MTANETPAALLRRAADRLDYIAAGTSRVPWYQDADEPNVIGASFTARMVTKLSEDCDSEDDAIWIAMLGPQVAPHLSAWLRGHADYIEGVQCSATPESLAFARSILGEAETS